MDQEHPSLHSGQALFPDHPKVDLVPIYARGEEPGKEGVGAGVIAGIVIGIVALLTIVLSVEAVGNILIILDRADDAVIVVFTHDGELMLVVHAHVHVGVQRSIEGGVNVEQPAGDEEDDVLSSHQTYRSRTCGAVARP